MNKKKIVLVTALVLVVVLVGAYALYDQFGGEVGLGIADGAQTNETAEVTNIGDTIHTAETTAATETTAFEAAPDFIFYDFSGNPRKLSEFRGKPVVLNFWASWCGPCKSEMPEFEVAYQTYGEQIQFLMMNLTDGYRETVESAQGYISTNGYTFPVFYDRDMDGSIAYHVTGVPVTYFIDAEGNLIAWFSGAISGEKLQMGIDLIHSSEK
ncbi:MAG: TlpA family protein disulfide reductase [Oscillospiraceae bacterium]|nr:TlpA family protein disulfide reductase [Oscillospiraceae bacterium]